MNIIQTCGLLAKNSMRRQPEWLESIETGLEGDAQFVNMYHLKYRQLIELCMCRWRLAVRLSDIIISLQHSLHRFSVPRNTLHLSGAPLQAIMVCGALEKNKK